MEYRKATKTKRQQKQDKVDNDDEGYIIGEDSLANEPLILYEELVKVILKVSDKPWN